MQKIKSAALALPALLLSAIQAYKPDKKHSIMMTYVCQLNFAKFFEKYNQL